MKKTPGAKLPARSTVPKPPVEERKAKGIARRDKVPSEAPYRSPAERRAEGKTLRDVVPRADHSGWKPPRERRDPVEIVLASNEGRLLDLVPIRHSRMMQSPFAFYRGTADQAEDFSQRIRAGLPKPAASHSHE